MACLSTRRTFINVTSPCSSLVRYWGSGGLKGFAPVTRFLGTVQWNMAGNKYPWTSSDCILFFTIFKSVVFTLMVRDGAEEKPEIVLKFYWIPYVADRCWN